MVTTTTRLRHTMHTGTSTPCLLMPTMAITAVANPVTVMKAITAVAPPVLTNRIGEALLRETNGSLMLWTSVRMTLSISRASRSCGISLKLRSMRCYGQYYPCQ